MEDHHNHLLNWASFFQEKSMEELRHSLLFTTMELEQTRIAAQEELRNRDEQIDHLKNLLKQVIKERDEEIDKFQGFLVEKLLLQQNNAPLSAISTIEDDPRRAMESNNGFSSSDCEESIVSSPTIDKYPPLQQLPMVNSGVNFNFPAKPSPEKGQLLQAVMKAGPLLQTLLLAGPLPQWRHPPPPLESFEIPPVTMDGGVKKRAAGETSDSPSETKFQRIQLLH